MENRESSRWEKVLDNVWRFRDSCNVYAIASGDRLLFVDAGTGAWLDHLSELPGKPAAILCTHYFRDHAAGAARAAGAGIPVYVPEYEESLFADPNQHFRQRETFIIYDNLWDLYAPIAPVAVTDVLRDYETRDVAGLAIEVIPLPGATLSQSGYGVTLADGRRAVFCGEAIHSPGKIARIAPLQYNYNDLPGAIQCTIAAKTLRAHQPNVLLPSLGEPILEDTDGALSLLLENLQFVAAGRPGMTDRIAFLDSPALERITDHVWWDRHSTANTWYLISRSGKALAIDYGYHAATCMAWQGYPKPERRRALRHGLDALQQQFGIERVDVVLVSHFHDDHVCGVPTLQRLDGTECWAAENFADLLSDPSAHCFPCTWPQPIRVDRRLPLDQSFTWEEFTFSLHPMSGHTRFASLIGFAADGQRFAHTGDQYFFQNDPGDWANNPIAQNHVYRNGALLDGYQQSGEWLQSWRPDIVLQGHQPPFFTDAAFFAQIADWTDQYEEIHRRLMPLADDQPHFNLDSWGGWIWPYRVHKETVTPFTVTATVRNPLPESAALTVRLVGPDGWEGEAKTLNAAARAEVAAELTIRPSGGACRRQPFAVELTVNDQPFGQVAEALATLGEPRF